MSLPTACAALAAGSSLIAAAVLASSLSLLFAAAVVVVGLGTGVGFSAGLRAINSRVPSARRGGAFSVFFVVLYAALVLPAIGVGIVIEIAGLRWAGGVFSALVAMVAVLVLLSLRRREA
ncbi:hypothetical protein ACFFX1_06430 [Dactylosporangium sucinum]|uniref:Major facilitator superfamily (MFS) profile domain-containing protein n=1 Tax=Dactylosporangium sucinum TaxID=1424081 RepID=A0A917U8P1_9ACTN|nr:hypothetical protein [Dactylosporangium sucinum]GGM62360.1 hypothetical protein GCM10007977_074920 [Dactylosporangium sucinum]